MYEIFHELYSQTFYLIIVSLFGLNFQLGLFFKARVAID